MQVALDDSFLQRETERQRHLQQEARKAIEQKKAQLRMGDVRRREQPTERGMDSEVTEKPLQRFAQVAQPALRQEAALAPSAAVGRADISGIDRVRSIPDMRSALIPLAEELEGTDWSPPFSLPQADMEPWISFLRGYRESRLFPEGGSAARDPDRIPQVDVAVQALLELKRINLKVIHAPAVQISGPAEYLDLAEELRVCSDPMLARSLAHIANDVHESQLAKAVEKGREMGNHLYEALLGDGHVNLIKAWEKVYRRRPTVHELHQMLTTGRVTPAQARPPAPEMRPQPPKTRVGTREALSDRSIESPARKEEPPPSDSATGNQPEVAPSIAADKPQPAGKRKILLHLFHLAASCSAIAAYYYYLMM